jgi:hypothetical protein
VRKLVLFSLNLTYFLLIFSKEANVNAVDEDGNSCLNLVLNDRIFSPEMGQNTSLDLKDCKLMSQVQ